MMFFLFTDGVLANRDSFPNNLRHGWFWIQVSDCFLIFLKGDNKKKLNGRDNTTFYFYYILVSNRRNCEPLKGAKNYE